MLGMEHRTLHMLIPALPLSYTELRFLAPGICISNKPPGKLLSLAQGPPSENHKAERSEVQSSSLHCRKKGRNFHTERTPNAQN